MPVTLCGGRLTSLLQLAGVGGQTQRALSAPPRICRNGHRLYAFLAAVGSVPEAIHQICEVPAATLQEQIGRIRPALKVAALKLTAKEGDDLLQPLAAAEAGYLVT